MSLKNLCSDYDYYGNEDTCNNHEEERSEYIDTDQLSQYKNCTMCEMCDHAEV